MKKAILKTILVLLVIAAFAFMALGSNSSDNPASQTPNSPETSNEEKNGNQSEENAEYEIGETSVSVWKSSIGTNWIKVAVPVTNTGNVNLYLETSSIDIEDSDGKLVETLSMVSVYPQVIKPGETAYYYEETTYDGTVTEGLKVVPHAKAEKAKVDLIRFDVSELQVKEGTFGASIMGRVKNTSDEEESMVYVIANLFDKNGKFIGQQFTILTDKLQVGETIGFETSSLTSQMEASDIAAYDVIAFPYQYQF